MTNTIQIIELNNIKENNTIQKVKEKIFCLDDNIDDDLHKIYFVESKNRRKYYQVIATAFGATSCSCIEQTKKPYQDCKHMKILDKILEYSSNQIQKVRHIP